LFIVDFLALNNPSLIIVF